MLIERLNYGLVRLFEESKFEVAEILPRIAAGAEAIFFKSSSKVGNGPGFCCPWAAPPVEPKVASKMSTRIVSRKLLAAVGKGIRTD